MTRAPLTGRLARLALLAVVLGLVSAAASCASSGGDVSLTDDTFSFHERTATTRGTIAPDAAADFDAAIAAARTSTTTALGGAASTTSVYVPRTTTTTTSGGSSTTAPGEASSTSTTTHVVTPDECRLYSQLLNFYSAIKPQVDANDPAGTASRVAGPVQQSAKGLDQILATAGPETKGQATKIIEWLRSAAAGEPVEADAAEGAFHELQDWFGANCGK